MECKCSEDGVCKCMPELEAEPFVEQRIVVGKIQPIEVTKISLAAFSETAAEADSE